jgi:hypothetical protein
MLFIYQQLQEFPDSPNFHLPIKLSFNVGLNILITFKNEKKVKHYLTHILTLILQIIIVRSTVCLCIVPHMVRVNNGFQTWHLMQTISAAKCICDVKIINSRPFVCVEFFFFSFFKGGSTFS